MRVAVIGAGAVGGALALLLDRAGHEVVLASRSGAEPARGRRTLNLAGAFGEHRAEFAQDSRLSGTFDLALVAVKAQDTQRAVEPHLAVLAATPTIVVQNGLEGAATVERLIAGLADRNARGFVAGGLATFAVNRPAPDEIRATANGSLTLGTASTAHTSRLEELAVALSPPSSVWSQTTWLLRSGASSSSTR